MRKNHHKILAFTAWINSLYLSLAALAYFLKASVQFSEETALSEDYPENVKAFTNSKYSPIYVDKRYLVARNFSTK